MTEPATSPCGPSGFTLIEMLVSTAVFALMIVMLLQLTEGLMSNANRTDENLKIDQDVRVLFDLMRRDLAQARIGTNQNQFYGTSTQVSFVSSASRLKTNYVSDQRLVTYYLSNNAIWRAVVEPTVSNYPAQWNPLVPEWWKNNVTAEAESLLEGVYPYSSIFPNPFEYILRNGVLTNTTDPTNPPSGLTVGFAIAGRRAIARGADSTNQLKKIKYDIELNIPPAFNP